MESTLSAPVPAGPWVEQWLSQPRLATYLAATGGDLDRALALYEWNCQLSTALMRDLSHLEVALRNSYDQAITSRWRGRAHWTAEPTRIFPPVFRTRQGRRVDINLRLREQLLEAVRRVGRSAPPGKVIAELPFGFWRYLSSAAHEKSLWVPYLHRAFLPGTDRSTDVDRPVTALHQLRNRVAHHEPLLHQPAALDLAAVVELARLIVPSLDQHIAATSGVAALLKRRP